MNDIQHKFRLSNGNWFVWHPGKIEDISHYLITNRGQIYPLKTVQAFDFMKEEIAYDIMKMNYNEFCARYKSFLADEDVFGLLKDLLEKGEIRVNSPPKRLKYP